MDQIFICFHQISEVFPYCKKTRTKWITFFCIQSIHFPESVNQSMNLNMFDNQLVLFYALRYVLVHVSKDFFRFNFLCLFWNGSKALVKHFRFYACQTTQRNEICVKLNEVLRSSLRCWNLTLFLISLCRYVVDAADRDSVPISRTELHDLLTKPSLGGIPLLVLGNKIDKSEALSKQALVDQL